MEPSSKGIGKRYAGRHEYEITAVFDGMTRDISIGPSGNVLEIAQQLSLNAVPAAAMATIQNEAKGVFIQKVEEIRSDSETAYEAQILRHRKHREVRVHADGSAAPEQN